VAETIKALKELSVFNSVCLLWIPGHSNIPGNETADQTVKQAASQDFVRAEPALGIPTTMIRIAAQLWANAQQRKLWQTTSGCRQAKMFLHGPYQKTLPLCSESTKMRAKNFSRPTYRVYNTQQTFNCYDDSRRSIMPSMWRTREDFIPLLGECCANMQIRYSIF